MALTDHEKRQLELLADQLLREDPRLAAKLRSGPAESVRPAHRAAGAFTLLVGAFVLLAGIAAQATPLGLVGFIIMASGAYLIFARTSLRLKRRPAAPSTEQRGPTESR
ncbi:DUF3040 domain-containing protein [Paenarthrobacter sp. NPDC092416]|uniref:DUF3040 domain-containing protein n=1 Tax=Paenarthrobacter sp. NPDC092416 TaxID=3364386 RepID=UPI0037FB235C